MRQFELYMQSVPQGIAYVMFFAACQAVVGCVCSLNPPASGQRLSMARYPTGTATEI